LAGGACASTDLAGLARAPLRFFMATPRPTRAAMTTTPPATATPTIMPVLELVVCRGSRGGGARGRGGGERAFCEGL
jgi:hypothetical protein